MNYINDSDYYSKLSEDPASVGVTEKSPFGILGSDPVVGGIVAGLKGIVGNSAARKQRQRDAAALLGKQTVDIEQQRSQLQSSIISNLARGLSSTIRGR